MNKKGRKWVEIKVAILSQGVRSPKYLSQEEVDYLVEKGLASLEPIFSTSKCYEWYVKSDGDLGWWEKHSYMKGNENGNS